MNKKSSIISNHFMMFRLYLKFAPAYCIGNLFFCVFVSFQDTISGPVAIQYMLNGVMGEKSFGEILGFMVFVCAVIVVRNLLGAYFAEYKGAQAGILVRTGMRNIIFDKARRMDIEYYENPEFYNDFVWAVAQGDNKIHKMFRSWSVLVARASEVLFVGGFMLLTDKRLIILAAASTAIKLIFSRLIIKKQYKMDLETKPYERRRDYITRVFYLADYAKEVRLSSMHRTLFGRLDSAMERIREIYKKGGVKLAAYDMISYIGSEAALDGIMYFYLCYQTIAVKAISLGDMAALTGAVYALSHRLKQLVEVFTEFGGESLYVDNFRKFLAYEPKIEEQPGERMCGNPQTIKLQNVSFRYRGEKNDSLKNISLEIKPYEKIAVVGYNGAGKSTLAKLLLRLYDVSSGEITVGGRNIKEFATEEYRGKFGSVFQDYKIFAGTVGENVAMYFTRESDRKSIYDSLVMSGFGERLETMPDGIDTKLTKEFDENGTNLSGGEEQKIAIARIFFKNCAYVILDEPSSALDPISEYKLNEAMLRLAEHKTVIFISHRLSSTCMADRIYMFENGEIAEQGTHKELMALDGKYAQMFKKQSEKYRI